MKIISSPFQARPGLLAVLAILPITLAGCGAMPKHALLRAPQQSALVIKDAPLGSTVSVDGRIVATITRKKAVVTIADGTHQVTVQSGDRRLYARTIFIEDGTQKIIQITSNQ